jgi:hypothetical protein
LKGVAKLTTTWRALGLILDERCIFDESRVREQLRGIFLGACRRLCELAVCRKLEIDMKKIALAAALSVAASTAFAGGVVEPVMEPEVVKAATTSSSGGVLIPLLLLVIVAAAVSAN